MILPRRRMRLGWLAEQRLDWPSLLHMTEQVERLGFDSVWLSDHLADEQGGWLLDPWTTLGALLARVPRLEAGTLVASNSLRSPLLTAHMARTLSEIAPGRFVLGLGAGGSREEHVAAGVTFDGIVQRVAALRDACGMIRRTTAAGSPWPDAPLGERPPIPLLLGGGGNAVLRLAGSLADRWAIWGTPEELTAKGSVISAAAREVGRDPAGVRRGAIVMILPDHLSKRVGQDHWPAKLDGNEQAVSRQLARYTEAGVEDLIVCDWGVAPGCRLAALTWLASVMSQTRASTGAET
jgi:alkanesulfonate monooxygenase SsuD/methylene tetrahydromethanopterin reductase-like flavin-dependent oxidoreductase (luciferase family)